MAQSLLALAFAAANVWIETALSAVKEIKATGATLFAVEIDNTSNTAMVYVKLFFATAASVTLGTTDPNKILPCPAGKKITYLIVGGSPYPTALSIACTTTKGTPGTTAPSQPVQARVAYT